MGGGITSTDVAAGDLNGDGNLDAVFINQNQIDEVCLGDGAGSFTCSGFDTGTTGRAGVTLGDVNGDGNLDAVAAGSVGLSAVAHQVCLGDGTGALTCSGISGTASDNGRDAALGDVDGDGDNDAFFGNVGTNQLCLNDGTGVFTCSDLTGETNGGEVETADVDNDGDVDAVFARHLATDRVCLNDGTGAFACSDVSANTGKTSGVALGDVDGDGNVDAVFAHIVERNRVCLGDGAGGFTCSDVSTDTFDSRDLALGDANGDGNLDAAFSNLQNQRNRICLGDGTGGFTCNDVSTDTDNSFSVAMAPLQAPAPPNSPPTVDAGGPYGGNEGAVITLSGATASDPDGDPLTLSWTVDASSVCSFSDATAQNPDLTCDDDGAYTVTLTADDGTAAPVSDAATVTVGNVAPTAMFTDDGPVNEGTSFTLSLSSPSDPSGADTTAGFAYAFDCGSGYGAFSGTSTATCPTTDDANLSVKGKIRDKDLGETEYTGSVTVNNVAPTISGITGPAAPVPAGTPVTVEVSFTDPGADTFDVTWDWGDTTSDTQLGLAGSPASESHTYLTPGVYAVTVTVTDDDGGTLSEPFEFVVVFDAGGKQAVGVGIVGTGGPGGPDIRFGLRSKNKNGATSGDFNFDDRVANVSMSANTVDNLWVFTDWAVAEGTGTLDSGVAVEWRSTIVDGALTPGGPDLFRVKIWKAGMPAMVLYDNQPGASDFARPTTAIDKGNLKIS